MQDRVQIYHLFIQRLVNDISYLFKCARTQHQLCDLQIKLMAFLVLSSMVTSFYMYSLLWEELIEPHPFG